MNNQKLIRWTIIIFFTALIVLAMNALGEEQIVWNSIIVFIAVSIIAHL